MKAFRTLRTRYSFIEILKNPELAVEVTMQPIEAFGMDAAIIFSDILVVADALGCTLEYQDQMGPKLHNRLHNMSDLGRLTHDAFEENISPLIQAIGFAKEALKKTGTPLIGFAAAPFTLASYMVGEEGKHDPQKFFSLYFKDTAFVDKVLDVLTEVTIRYLRAQVKAGIDAIQIFDSWIDVLPWPLVEKLSVNYVKRIVKEMQEFNLPITVFGTAMSVFYPLYASTGVQVISLDSRIDLAHARQHIPSHIAIQGNLNPYFLLASKKELKEEVLRLLTAMEGRNGYIFNLGHGVPPMVDEDNVKFVVDLVHNRL